MANKKNEPVHCSMAKLTPKQNRFVAEYLVDLSATAAAKRSGYSPKTAYKIGSENLRKPQIAKRIEDQMNQRAERTEITADWVLNEIRQSLHRSKEKQDENNVLRASELLGKHLKLFTDKVEQTGEQQVRVSFNIPRPGDSAR